MIKVYGRLIQPFLRLIILVAKVRKKTETCKVFMPLGVRNPLFGCTKSPEMRFCTPSRYIFVTPCAHAVTVVSITNISTMLRRCHTSLNPCCRRQLGGASLVVLLFIFLSIFIVVSIFLSKEFRRIGVLSTVLAPNSFTP